MTEKQADPKSADAGALPGPEAMLGAWASWMQAAFANGAMQAASPQGPSPVNEAMEAMLANGARQMGETLAQDPMLRSLDQLWNANPLREVIPVDWAGIAWALRLLALRSARNPGEAFKQAAEFNARLWRSTAEVWAEAGRQWWGLPTEAAPPAADKRFAAPEWNGNPVYRTMKETYLKASEWLLRLPEETDDLTPAERQKLEFHLHQFVDAMSPSLMLASNPVALRRAIETGGASVAEGARNLLADLRDGKLSMVDTTAFAPGRNLALSPGKVVFRNQLIELIQYAPSGDSVHEIPLLILPPWINKFYILDLQPKNSLVKYLVGQGFTVFMISWRNPDAAMEGTTFEDYMDLGPLAASDVVREITGSPTVNVMGYCIGGTLLAITLAWLARKQDRRFGAVTFMVSLQDFSRVGDTAVFMGGDTVDFIEQQMLERGYLDSREMSNMFNLLRSNDLIWSNVVNNYLLGQKPPAFDLLYWNSDGTRMARAAHGWYLRNTYVENNLIEPNRVTVKGEPLDLGMIHQDVYAVGAEKDHIVPWDAAWRVTKLLGGQIRYVLASSGHIAGIINPPGGKGIFWDGDPADSPEAWRAHATRHDGSWWTDWSAWLAARSGDKGTPPAMGSATHAPVQDAPGSYVLEK